MNTNNGSVNGPSCRYVKFAYYNSCSEDQVKGVDDPNRTDYNFTGSADLDYVFDEKTGTYIKKESFRERFEDVASEYKPTYKVPNYPPINVDSLTHGIKNNCGGYFNILDAYGKTAGNCVTNFINN